MPELPEVENMKLSLQEIEGNSIENIVLSDKNLRQNADRSLLPILRGAKINQIVRLAKYLIFHLDNSFVLIFHAGMSGKFVLGEINENPLEKHDHVNIFLSSGKVIKYNDPRRFGLFLIVPATDYLGLPIFKDIGVDALSNEFNGEYLTNKLHRISSNIKNTLLNQKIVAGMGNIYASESLFYAGLSPTREAKSLSLEENTKLVGYIKKVLLRSIKAGGSTLKDYRKADGEMGGFQNLFVVYSREGLSCLRDDVACKGVIHKITQNGRATYFCPICQE